MPRILAAFAVVALLAAVLWMPVGGNAAPAPNRSLEAEMDLTTLSSAPPNRAFRLLFIHHSCGGHLLAEPGPEVTRGGECIYTSHPSGGGLRNRLQQEGYEVHEASYRSVIGDRTDMFDWLPKFRHQMDRVLVTDMNDVTYDDGRKNQIVVFKSCYPQNELTQNGVEPGAPEGPELTLSNCRATMTALLGEFRKRPEVLFVYVTAPPISPYLPREPLWKYLAKRVLRKGVTADALARQSELARTFNNWMASPDGWLKDYPHRNVAVFNYYDILTGHGASNLSRYVPSDGDSHPTREGQALAAEEFVPFLNRAVRRAGMTANNPEGRLAQVP